MSRSSQSIADIETFVFDRFKYKFPLSLSFWILFLSREGLNKSRNGEDDQWRKFIFFALFLDFPFIFEDFIPARMDDTSTIPKVAIVPRSSTFLSSFVNVEGREGGNDDHGGRVAFDEPLTIVLSLSLSLFSFSFPILFPFQPTEPFRTRIILGNENELKGELIESLAFARPTIEERTRFKGIRFYARNRRRPRINITTLSR